MHSTIFEKRSLHPAMNAEKSAEHKVQSQRGKEDLQSFRERGGCIVRKKGAQRREQKCRLSRSSGKQTPCHVGDDETSAQIKQGLDEQHGPKVIIAEESEH